MFDKIHSEGPGQFGYSLAIAFYFGCITAIFFLVTVVILPIGRSIFGKTASTALPYIAA